MKKIIYFTLCLIILSSCVPTYRFVLPYPVIGNNYPYHKDWRHKNHEHYEHRKRDYH